MRILISTLSMELASFRVDRFIAPVPMLSPKLYLVFLVISNYVTSINWRIATSSMAERRRYNTIQRRREAQGVGKKSLCLSAVSQEIFERCNDRSCNWTALFVHGWRSTLTFFVADDWCAFTYTSATCSLS